MAVGKAVACGKVELEWIPGAVVFSATFVESKPFYHNIEEVCGV